jgi:hypothetical protein
MKVKSPQTFPGSISLGNFDATSHQFIEQAPGPRGSPQLPHGPAARVAFDAVPVAETANTESFGASCWLAHFGHSALCEP